MRIMLDTNILILAFIFKSKILNNFIDNITKKHEIIICSYTIEEINEEKISYPPIKMKQISF